MIEPFQEGQDWILAFNVHEFDARGLRGTRDHSGERIMLIFDKCWTGSEWARQIVFAKKFSSRDDAELYQVQNEQQMLDKLG